MPVVFLVLSNNVSPSQTQTRLIQSNTRSGQWCCGLKVKRQLLIGASHLELAVTVQRVC